MATRLHAFLCLASFPDCRRNGLATSTSSNCYFRCQKSWQYQSNFRMLSHDNSKTKLCHALNCHSHAHSISIAMLDWASMGALHDDCFSKDLYLTSVVEPTENSCFHEQESPILTAGKIVSITCINWLVEWDSVTLHLYTVWIRRNFQAISPMAWERGYVMLGNHQTRG